MFKLIPNPTFEAVAKIPAAGGEVLDLKLVFKHKTVKQTQEFLARAAKGETTDLDLFMELVADWLEVDTPFSREAVEVFMDSYHDTAQPVMDAFLSGLRGAKLGN